MKRLAVTIAVSALSLTSTAFAQTSHPVDSAYFGIEAGKAINRQSSDDTVRILTNNLGGSASASQSADVTVYRGFWGFNVNENVGFELGYTYSGEASSSASGVTGSGVAYSANLVVQFAGIDYSVLLRPSVSTGLNGLFFKLGGHQFATKYEARAIAGVTSAVGSDSDTGGGTMAGIGYDYKLSDKNVIRLAYTRFEKVSGLDLSADLFTIGYLRHF